MVTKLCQSATDPNSYKTSLTVTGAGGFGKTSIVTALCHHPVIKEKFTDGVVFIELGPQSTNPSMKLSQLYHLLTGQCIKQGNITHAEQEIDQLTSFYCRNLLVIIDDVWHIEDAEPIVKAFRNCKIVLTTRMNDIEQYIPTEEVITVGPMDKSEAISLLICGVIDISQLSHEIVNLLEELAQDVHLWPLLLSLIRGQLSRNLKLHTSSYHKAVQNVQSRLHYKGLTAFDKGNIERSRKRAASICIDLTLELLTKAQINKLQTLILWTGIGTSLQTAVLHHLWNITEDEAMDVVEVLWVYGLVQFTDITLSPCTYNVQKCVEVHTVISQYIIEFMNSNTVYSLLSYGGLGTSKAVYNGLFQQFKRCYGIRNDSSLHTIDFLKYAEFMFENFELPYLVKRINMCTVSEPHLTIETLQKIKYAVKMSPSISTFLPSLCDDITSLITDCHKMLKDSHNLSRKINQDVQQCLTERNYNKLIKTIEEYIRNYPVGLIAQKAVSIMKKVIPYCDGELLHYMAGKCEDLQVRTPNYNFLALLTLPRIKFTITKIQKIHSSLQKASPDDIKATYLYYVSHKMKEEEEELLHSNYLVKLQEDAQDNFTE